jgi:hypothetical protein
MKMWCFLGVSRERQIVIPKWKTAQRGHYQSKNQGKFYVSDKASRQLIANQLFFFAKKSKTTIMDMAAFQGTTITF